MRATGFEPAALWTANCPVPHAAPARGAVRRAAIAAPRSGFGAGGAAGHGPGAEVAGSAAKRYGGCQQAGAHGPGGSAAGALGPAGQADCAHGALATDARARAT